MKKMSKALFLCAQRALRAEGCLAFFFSFTAREAAKKGHINVSRYFPQWTPRERKFAAMTAAISAAQAPADRLSAKARVIALGSIDERDLDHV